MEPPWSSDADMDGNSEAERAPGIVRMLSHPLMIMDSALRAYGHPDILKMIASVNGPDFVPFSESVFHKAAYEGFPTRWHQDGRDALGRRRNEPGAAGRVGQDARRQPVRIVVSLHAGERPLGDSGKSPPLAPRAWRQISADHRMATGRGSHDPDAGRLRPRQSKLDAWRLSEPVRRTPRQHDHGLPQPGLGNRHGSDQCPCLCTDGRQQENGQVHGRRRAAPCADDSRWRSMPAGSDTRTKCLTSTREATWVGASGTPRPAPRSAGKATNTGRGTLRCSRVAAANHEVEAAICVGGYQCTGFVRWRKTPLTSCPRRKRATSLRGSRLAMRLIDCSCSHEAIFRYLHQSKTMCS